MCLIIKYLNSAEKSTQIYGKKSGIPNLPDDFFVILFPDEETRHNYDAKSIKSNIFRGQIVASTL
ncbi:MAG: hypothetical protein Kow00127_18940 [Bacteroidales bacterium]